MTLYQQAGAAYAVPWPVLAAIGAIESDHGRSTAPGVHSGVNAFGCCAGPMQFNLTNGPPSTWQTYARRRRPRRRQDPYDPADAIPSAARYLRVLLAGTHGDIARAVLGYNHSPAYVEDVLARARAYSARSEAALIAPAGAGLRGRGRRHRAGEPADRRAPRLPRAYAMLPAWAMAGGRPRSRSTRACSTTRCGSSATTACASRRRARAATTRTATAPRSTSSPPSRSTRRAWDASAGALARDLGWTPACGLGTRPACALVPAIQFVGYEGYPDHGSPRTCSRRMLRPPARLVGVAVSTARARPGRPVGG